MTAYTPKEKNSYAKATQDQTYKNADFSINSHVNYIFIWILSFIILIL